MSQPVWSYPSHCAHRGAGKLAPENTLAAIRHGAGLGYRMFEFDVKLSSDGALVLMHDPMVERTTDGRGRVASFTLGELARLDAGGWHSPAYAGEGVPTLARVAHWLRANECNSLSNVHDKLVDECKFALQLLVEFTGKRHRCRDTIHYMSWHSNSLKQPGHGCRYAHATIADAT